MRAADPLSPRRTLLALAAVLTTLPGPLAAESAPLARGAPIGVAAGDAFQRPHLAFAPGKASHTWLVRGERGAC